MRVASTIQFGLSLLFTVARAGAARADPERPPGGQRNPLLGLLLLGPLLRGELLRPRLPRRQPAIRPLRRPDPLRIVLPDDLRGAGRGQLAERRVGGRDRDHRGAGAVACWSSPSPSPAAQTGESDARRRPSAAATAEATAGEDLTWPRRRLRRGGAADHVLRTGLPQRRPADHPRPSGRRRGRAHLQRADAGAGTAAALPVGLDLDPPPPHQPPHQRRPGERA